MKSRLLSQQDGRKGYQPQAYPHAAYAAMVSRLDQYVGDVRKQVEALSIADNTLILFASDNGPHKEGGMILCSSIAVLD
ncbi:sulfatase-like hydrolase/transferase [Niabella hibiscisoli]|uniref:sulfatase-like hydrolase/transferase n=1 Tax=Niabella hibiscisoli TaxID=1825928 RepID=UPI0021D45C73|nr:sulfatase-like hydrolase/transferase [Niabella hibiscisoli]